MEHQPNTQGQTLASSQHRLFADIMPARAVKPRFLELTAKPESYELTGLRAGGPKSFTGKDGKPRELNVLVVAQLRDATGAAYEWELTSKNAYRDLRGILEQLGPAQLDALTAGSGSVALQLASHGSGKDTTYTIKAA